MSNLHLSTLVLESGDPSMCEYLFKGNKSAPYAIITFNSAPGMTTATLKDGLTQGQKDVQAVPGLADAAFSFSATRGVGLTFLSGDIVCSIVTVVPTTTADEVALAKSIIGG